MAKDVFELVILKGSQEGKRLRFQTETVTIGRNFDNSIVVNSPTVSAHNAQITLQADEFIIEDLQSMNGTFVNNKKIERRKLHSGDKIEIGSALLLFMRKGEDPIDRPEEESEEISDNEGHKTMVMGATMQEMLSSEGIIKKEVPKVTRNPVVIILSVLILLVSGTIGFFYLKPYIMGPTTDVQSTKKADKKADGTPAPSEEIELPRIERGDMTSAQILAKADDHYNRGKMSYNSRKLKEENLFEAAEQFKLCLAYLTLTDEHPPFYEEVRPLLEQAVKELDEEYNQLLFLARRYSRQQEYVQAKDYHSKIMRLIPDPEDPRHKASDRAIKYFIAKNLVKS